MQVLNLIYSVQKVFVYTEIKQHPAIMSILYKLLAFLFELFISIKLWIKSFFKEKPPSSLYQLLGYVSYGHQQEKLAEVVFNSPVNLDKEQLRIHWPLVDPTVAMLVCEFRYKDKIYKCPLIRGKTPETVYIPVYSHRELDLSIPEEFHIVYPNDASEQQLIRQYAGPLGDFYHNKGLSVSPNDIIGLSEPKIILQDIFEEQFTFTKYQKIALS